MLPIYQREAMWLSFRASELPRCRSASARCARSAACPGSSAWSKIRRTTSPCPISRGWMASTPATVSSASSWPSRLVPAPPSRAGHRAGDPRWRAIAGGRPDGAGAGGMACGAAGAAGALRGHVDGGAASVRRPTGHGAGSGRADAPGGLRRQTPLTDYDQSGALRVFVHLCSAAQWTAITGELPPRRRSTGRPTWSAGLPWFDYYDSDAEDLAPSGILTEVKTVGDVLGDDEEPFAPVDPKTVIPLGDPAWIRSVTGCGECPLRELAEAHHDARPYRRPAIDELRNTQRA